MQAFTESGVLEGIGGEIGHDPVEMLARADHWPEMADHIGVLKLGERGLGDHLQRLSRGVRNEVEMDAVHCLVAPV